LSRLLPWVAGLLLFLLGAMTLLAVRDRRRTKRLQAEITDLRRQEGALRARLEQFYSMAESIRDGLTILGDGKVVYLNDRACEILGRPREELIGLSLSDLVGPEERARLHEIEAQNSEAAPSIAELEFWIAREDGTRRCVQNRYAVDRDGGRVTCRYVVTTDVTERREAEEARQKYAERVAVLREIDQAVLAAESTEAIAQAAVERIRCLIPCQRASVALFDLQADEAHVAAAHVSGETRLGRGERIPVTSFDGLSCLRAGHHRAVADILAIPDPSEVAQALLAEGIRSYLHAPLISRGELIGALSVGAGTPDAFSAEHVDIAREVADQLAVAIQNARLLDAERRRSAELEALRQASIHLTSSLELQPVLEAILEHTLHLVAADDAHIFLYDGEQLTFGAALWAGGARKEPFSTPREHGLTYTVARSGERIVVPDVDTHPLFQDDRWGGAIVGLPLCFDDRVRGVMNVAWDRPHRFSQGELDALQLLADQAAIAIRNARLHQQVRRHAQDLAAALERSQELERLKSQFVQNVSHELRSPLSLIRGYAELLERGELGDLAPRQADALRIIARRARMLNELVKDITLILVAESRPSAREPVALGELARAAVDDFSVAARQAQLTVEAEIAPNLPRVWGEVTCLRRVLDNLLSNAIKFTPPGGRISVRVGCEAEQVILQVTDTGIGIPADQQEQVFDRFYQVDGSTRRRYGGVGLGLALVKEVVEGLGGRVGVDSEVGRGSTFTVALPTFQL
jgi:PAS domain S-box-containing protein